VAKGKEHKKYEFGTNASVALTKTHGVIVAAVAHEKNLYDALEATVPEPQPGRNIVEVPLRASSTWLFAAVEPMSGCGVFLFPKDKRFPGAFPRKRTGAAEFPISSLKMYNKLSTLRIYNDRV
jgi:hypothetical protein